MRECQHLRVVVVNYKENPWCFRIAVLIIRQVPGHTVWWSEIQRSPVDVGSWNPMIYRVWDTSNRWLFGSSWINNSIAILFKGSLSLYHDESQTIVSSLFVFVFGVAPFLVNSLFAGIVGLGNSSKRIMRTRMFYYKCQCIKSSELGFCGQCSMKCLQSLILKHVF